jgi:creatinine amidohydrolase
VVPQRPCDGAVATPPAGWSLEGAAPCAWLASDLSRSGVVGDARGSDPALGRALAERLVRAWRDRFERLLASDWPPGCAIRTPAPPEIR